MRQETGGIPEEVSAQIVAAIRANHLTANVGGYEVDAGRGIVHWDRARVDPGGTFLFGPGPYLKVPITMMEDGVAMGEITVRVRAPERLRRKLAKLLPGNPVVGPDEGSNT